MFINSETNCFHWFHTSNNPSQNGLSKIYLYRVSHGRSHPLCVVVPTRILLLLMSECSAN